MKTIVIGGGVSGFASAISAKNEDNEVIILEKNSEPLKKLLITGNGRCNYFNDDTNILHYHSNTDINNYFNSEDLMQVLEFMNNIGINPDIKNGYYYPKSNQAISVKNALIKEAKVKGIDIITDTIVTNVYYENNKFIIETNNKKYDCDILVLSLGGKSAFYTGSNGEGYNLASNLGHTITDITPGLVQLESKDLLNKASGVRVNAKLTLYENGKLIKEEIGEAQITDYGISGICAMQLSSYISKGLLKGNREVISINFMPEVDDIKTFLINRDGKLSNRTISELLDPLLNYKLVNVLLKKSKIDNDSYLCDLSIERLNKLVENLSDYELYIDGTRDFKDSQVTVGGVDLKEVNCDYSSKIVDNLFIVGELLDVNGDCGGYNIMFAILSGIKSGLSIRGKND